MSDLVLGVLLGVVLSIAVLLLLLTLIPATDGLIRYLRRRWADALHSYADKLTTPQAPAQVPTKEEWIN